ncbi:MAG: hypothetical protein V8R02_04535 [Clostridium sp.]
MEIGNEESEKVFDKVDELLEYEIDGQKIRNIIKYIKPYFRCF